ncbi:MAG: NUDIX hydrolase [Acidobacteria bacterium]|nr:NUDIX hydrolase [Acidobacteriota bacterium]
MPCEHRIAAGGLVIEDGKILLVRYRGEEGTYLVAPGGAIEDGESLSSAAEREVEEETGVKCEARAAVMIENLRATRYQMVKVWYLCKYVGGAASRTAGAVEEGIIEVGWYADAELLNETVFPEVIRAAGVASLDNLQTGIIDPGVRYARF